MTTFQSVPVTFEEDDVLLEALELDCSELDNSELDDAELDNTELEDPTSEEERATITLDELGTEDEALLLEEVAMDDDDNGVPSQEATTHQ